MESARGVAQTRPVAPSMLHSPALAASAASASCCSDARNSPDLASSSDASCAARMRSRLSSKLIATTIGMNISVTKTGTRAMPQNESAAVASPADTNSTMLPPIVTARRRSLRRHRSRTASTTKSTRTSSDRCAIAISGVGTPGATDTASPNTSTLASAVISRKWMLGVAKTLTTSAAVRSAIAVQPSHARPARR